MELTAEQRDDAAELRRLRARIGLTSREAAGAIHTSKDAICRAESGLHARNTTRYLAALVSWCKRKGLSVDRNIATQCTTQVSG